MAKKALAILFLFFTLLVGSTKISYAQSFPAGDDPWSPSDDKTAIESYRAAIEADGCMTPSLECLVHQTFQFVAIDFVHSTLYPGSAPNLGNGAQQVPYDPNDPTPVASAQQSSLLTGMGRLIGHMYAYPAANTGTYIADLMDSAHITPQAYAQGLGFASLNPILELWKAFRNVAYMFFVVIFIIIGFMIMFRQRISGQAAVTAQQAIPSVIISLILVTFSYAIAGFMIDLMYVLMFLIIGVFGQTLPEGSQNLIDMSILQVMGAMFKATNVLNPGANIDLVSNLFGSLLQVEALNQVLGVVGGLTLTVVLAVAILIGTVKLFFELLKSYASIVLSVVTSPIVLMMGALPGRNPVVPWLKDLAGNLLAFPVVLLVLVLFYQFTNLTGGAGNEGGFIPPFLIARGQAGAISSLMGLALILALPEIVKDAKKGLVKEGFGSMVFKAAAGAAKTGFVGGAVIPGIAATTIPGAKALGAPLFGTKASRKAAEEGKDTWLGRGAVGGAWSRFGKPYAQAGAAVATHRIRERFTSRTSTTETPRATEDRPKPKQASAKTRSPIS